MAPTSINWYINLNATNNFAKISAQSEKESEQSHGKIFFIMLNRSLSSLQEHGLNSQSILQIVILMSKLIAPFKILWSTGNNATKYSGMCQEIIGLNSSLIMQESDQCIYRIRVCKSMEGTWITNQGELTKQVVTYLQDLYHFHQITMSMEIQQHVLQQHVVSVVSNFHKHFSQQDILWSSRPFMEDEVQKTFCDVHGQKEISWA